MKEPDVSGAIQHRIRPSINERHQRLLSGLRLESGAPRWEKALWNRHPEYEDNYVPSDFLASTKAKFEERKILPTLRAIALRQAVPQTTFTSFISLVISVFRSLLERSIGAADVLLLCAFSCIIAGLGFKVCSRRNRVALRLPVTTTLPGTARLGGSANYILPPFLLYLCSPLLLSLTKATTSDSIWPLAGGLFMLSSILGGFGGDYQDDETQEADEEDEGLSATSPVASNRAVVMSPMLKRGMRKRRASAASLTAPEVESPQEKAKILQSCLSVTSCLSACIVLASRLDSSWEVFSLLSFVGLTMGALIWSSRAVTPLGIKISIAATLQVLALLACYQRSTAIRDMPFSPEGALILANFALCILAPVLIRQAWRWHIG